MQRSIALRASALFILFAALFAVIGTTSSVQLTTALFLISGALSALMLAFAATAPVRAAIPVRVRRRR
jgi:hypothetical protein